MISHNKGGYLTKGSRDRQPYTHSKVIDPLASSVDGAGGNVHPQLNFDNDQSMSIKGNNSMAHGSIWNSCTVPQDRRIVTNGGQFKAKALKEIKVSLEPYQRDDGDIDKAMLEKFVKELGYERDVVIEVLKANREKSFEVIFETLNSMTALSGRKSMKTLQPGSLQYARAPVGNVSANNGYTPSPAQRSTPTRNLDSATSFTRKMFDVGQPLPRGNSILYQADPVVRVSNSQGGRLPVNVTQRTRIQPKVAPTSAEVAQRRGSDVFMAFPHESSFDTIAALEGVRLRQKKLEPKDPQKRWSVEVLQNMRGLDLGDKRNSLEFPNRPPPPYPGYGQDSITESPWLLPNRVLSSSNLKRIGSQDTLLPFAQSETLSRTKNPQITSSNPPAYDRHFNYNAPDIRTQGQVPVISGNIPGPSMVTYPQGQITQQMKDPPPYELAASQKAIQRTLNPGDKPLLVPSKLPSRPSSQIITQGTYGKPPIVDIQNKCFIPINSDKFGSVENVNSVRMSDSSLTPRGSPPPYSADGENRMSLNLEDIEFQSGSAQSDSSASTSPTPDGVERSCSPLPVTSSPHQTLVIHRNGTLEQNFDVEKTRKECSRFFPRVKSYSPNAFMFFMEQHVENVIKSQEQRKKRRKQLEDEMARVGLSDEAQEQMRKMLNQKESNYNRLKRAKMNISLFTKIKTFGLGAFGEVSLVRKIDTNALYAMKTLRKSEVLRRNQVAHVKAERDILAEADNEWVVKLYYSFQDEVNLYFVMDYIPGGDLMALLIKFGIFSEELARFYTSELVLALESVHAMGFIHRDIKPDNILIDRTGHIKLTDFGLCTGFRWTHNSKYYQKNSDINHQRQYSMEPEGGWESHNLPCDCGELKRRFNLCKPLERRAARKHMRCQAHSLVGTPNYIAPEVLRRVPYTKLCDWWSVGVILYEMVVGQPPFFAPSPAETQLKVINWRRELVIPRQAKITPEAKDLIMKLCTDAEERLGAQGTDDIKSHAFFRQVDWVNGPKSSKAPYIPQIRHATDTSNFDPVPENSMQDEVRDKEADRQIREQGPEHAFYEFTFRTFFDDGGHPLTIYDNEPPSKPTSADKNTIPSSSSNKRTADASNTSVSVPNKLAAPPINQGSQTAKSPVYV